MIAAWLEALGGAPTKLAAGEVRDASDQDEILFVETGLIVVRGLDEGQRDAFALLRRAPSVIGVERMDSTAHAYELHALTDVTLRVVSADELRALRDEASPPHRSLIRCCVETLGAVIDDLVATSGSAPVRVARLLLNGSDGGVRVSRVPRHLWAEVLSMRAETLSRVLNTLQAKGWIRVSGERIDVLDEVALERFVATNGA